MEFGVSRFIGNSNIYCEFLEPRLEIINDFEIFQMFLKMTWIPKFYTEFSENLISI